MIHKISSRICSLLLVLAIFSCTRNDSAYNYQLSKDTSEIEKLNKLSEYYWENDAEKSKTLANDALLRSTAINYKSGIIQAKNNLGVVYDIIGKYDSALIFYREALILSKQEKLNTLSANIINNIGLIYWNQSRPKDALIQFHEAYKLFENSKNIKGLAKTCNNLGLIYADIANSLLCKEYTLKALNYYIQLKDTMGMSVVYSNLGNFYTDKDDYLNAERYFKLAYDLKQKKDLYGQSVVLINWAETKIHLDQTDTAEHMLLSIIPVKIKLNDKIGIITTFNILADLYYSQKKHQQALSSAYKALSINHEVRSMRKEKKIYERLYNNYLALNILDSTQKYRDLEHHITDSIYSEQMADEVAKYSVKYKILEKEKENLELNQKIKQKNLTLFAIILSTILFSLLFWLIYSRYKLKKETQLNLLIQKSALDIVASEQKERTRIAAELHDSVGQSLTLLKMYAANAESLHSKFNEVLNNTITEVRSISHNLMPEIVNLGLVYFINDICLKINATNTIKCTFNFDPKLTSVSFSKDVELSLYRILQEISGNMLKHSKCTWIKIDIGEKSGKWHIHIIDNGIGFDLNEINHSKGIGFSNIFTRAKLIDAEIDIKSNSKGTVFDIKLPC